MSQELFDFNDALSDRLRQESLAMSPQFSPALHDRIMQRIRSATPLPRLPRTWMWMGLSSLAAAASVAFFVALADRSGAPAPTQMKQVAAKSESVARVAPSTPPALPPIGTALAQVTAPASQQLAEARYAYLDRDAQRLSEYLLNHVNVLPTAR